MDDGFFSKSEMMVVKAPPSAAPLCGACGLHKTCRSPKMPPAGGGRQRIMIVAEAPGADEDEAGEPLVGKTGRHLAAVLGRYGVDLRRDCILTNAVICRPPENNLNPHRSAVDYCRPNLLRTIAKYDPEVIIPLGAVAVRSLIGHLWREDTGGINRWVGWRIPCHRPNAWVCPTFHPSFLMREEDPVYDMMFAEHLRAAVACVGRPWRDGPPDYARRVDVITNPAEAAARIKKYTAGTVAFDYESVSLKPDGRDTYLVSCSVCWEGEETIAFPWHGPAVPAMMDLLTNPDVGKIASNIKHEDRWTRAKLGVAVRGWAWDTMLSAHALDPRGGISGLKFQAFVRLGCPDYSAHIEPFLVSKEKGGNSINRIRDVSLPMILRYNGLDSVLEYDVAMRQMKEMGV